MGNVKYNITNKKNKFNQPVELSYRLLMFENPLLAEEVVSYDIVEVKREEFNEDALKQLISYESWFLQKKVSGDSNMVRTTAIAKSYIITTVKIHKGFNQKK